MTSIEASVDPLLTAGIAEPHLTALFEIWTAVTTGRFTAEEGRLLSDRLREPPTEWWTP